MTDLDRHQSFRRHSVAGFPSSPLPALNTSRRNSTGLQPNGPLVGVRLPSSWSRVTGFVRRPLLALSRSRLQQLGQEFSELTEEQDRIKKALGSSDLNPNFVRNSSAASTIGGRSSPPLTRRVSTGSKCEPAPAVFPTDEECERLEGRLKTITARLDAIFSELQNAIPYELAPQLEPPGHRTIREKIRDFLRHLHIGAA